MYTPDNLTGGNKMEDCWLPKDETCGHEGLGGGLIHTGKADCAISVAMLIDDTGLGIGDMDVFSIRWGSSLLKQTIYLLYS